LEAICLAGFRVPAGKPASQSADKEASIPCITYISAPSISVKLANINEHAFQVMKTGGLGINRLCANHAKLGLDIE
jgi:hypothetical protein